MGRQGGEGGREGGEEGRKGKEREKREGREGERERGNEWLKVTFYIRTCYMPSTTVLVICGLE